MRKTTFCFIIVVLILSTFGWQNSAAQNIIPQPVEIKNGVGQFRLTAATNIGCNNSEAQSAAIFLSNKIKTATGFAAKIGKIGQIQLTINATKNATIGAEGYTLNVSPKGVQLAANTAAGLFYGVQTLIQLLPKEIENQSVTKANWIAPSVKIVDYPRFGWRGMMLDVSRHFFTKEEVKRYIDRLSQYKYNVFHWHLTDDQGWRIEIKSLPKLTQIGACRVPRFGKWGTHEREKPTEMATDCGFYTQEDVREIVAYAAERHVAVLPEIDVPGHSMAAIAAYPELSCTRDTTIRVNAGSKFTEWYGGGKFKMLVDNALNPCDDGVYTFLDKVFTEVAALFPFDYVHMGGDECYHGYWEADANCQALMQREGLKSSHELQSFFVKKVEKILKSKGKKLIGWDEILEGGLASEAAVMSWRGFEGGIEAAKLGHNVVMSPNDYVYLDLNQGEIAAEPDVTAYKTVRLRTSYDFEPTPEGVDAKYILGGQANLWTEKVPTLRHAEYMAFPRAWALADVYWSPRGTKNWENFIVRMEKHMARADIAGANYARSTFDAVVKPSLVDGKLVVEISTDINGLDIFYTLNETTPDKYTPQYKTPFEMPEGKDVTLKVVTYRNSQPVGKIIALSREELKKRAVKK